MISKPVKTPTHTVQERKRTLLLKLIWNAQNSQQRAARIKTEPCVDTFHLSLCSYNSTSIFNLHARRGHPATPHQHIKPNTKPKCSSMQHPAVNAWNCGCTCTVHFKVYLLCTSKVFTVKVYLLCTTKVYTVKVYLLCTTKVYTAKKYLLCTTKVYTVKIQPTVHTCKHCLHLLTCHQLLNHDC